MRHPSATSLGMGCPHLLLSINSASRQAGAVGSTALPLVRLCAEGVLLVRGRGACRMLGLHKHGHHQLCPGPGRPLSSTESPARLWGALRILPQRLPKSLHPALGWGRRSYPALAATGSAAFRAVILSLE